MLVPNNMVDKFSFISVYLLKALGFYLYVSFRLNSAKWIQEGLCTELHVLSATAYTIVRHNLHILFYEHE